MTTDKVRSNMQMLKRARTFIIPQLTQTENCSNDIHIICKENELMKDLYYAWAELLQTNILYILARYTRECTCGISGHI